MTEEERTAAIVAKITEKVEALNEAAARRAAEIEEIEALKAKALGAIRAIGALNAEPLELLRAKEAALCEVADAAADYAVEAELELEELEAALGLRHRRRF